MNKRIFCVVISTIIVCSLLFSSCSLFDSTNKQVIYEYNNETIYITVKEGAYYGLDEIPEKFGYTFEGLFDADGKQYISAKGESLTAYEEKEDSLKLYIHFKPINYSIKLDFNGAIAPSGGTLTAEYDEVVPQLPTNLYLEGKTFSGWFTLSDCKGLKVAGSDGVSQATVNENNFNLEGGVIKLYAGFESIMPTVTFRDISGSIIKTQQVSYGDNPADIANAIRVNGMGVFSWRGGLPDRVTENTELVVEEYAPIIEFDSCGGNVEKELISRAGSSITLPVPQKANNNFLYWENENGQEFSNSVMPAQSVRLRAVWQPKIVFDSNGGSKVNDIAQMAGTSVTLPSTARAGFIFAGWFTETGDAYSTAVMPADGIALKAGWARIITKTFDLMGSNNYVTNESKFRKVDLQEYNPKNLKMRVHVKLHFQAKHFSSSSIVFDGYNDLIVGYYSQATTMQSYALCASKRLAHDKVKDYRVYNLEQDLTVTDGLFFVVFTSGSNYNGVQLKDCYAEVEFPDFSNIEL